MTAVFQFIFIPKTLPQRFPRVQRFTNKAQFSIATLRILEVKLQSLMKTIAALLLTLTLTASAIAADFDPRATFGSVPGRDLDSALKKSAQTGKRVLLFYWNSKEKSAYPGLDMKYFAELEETKKLIKENFILVLLDRDHKDAKPYLADNTEKPRYVLIGSDGKAIKEGPAAENPEWGLKRVKELVAMP